MKTLEVKKPSYLDIEYELKPYKRTITRVSNGKSRQVKIVEYWYTPIKNNQEEK